MSSIWGSLRLSVHPILREMCDLVVKAFMWNVWLVRNDCIFNANVIPGHAIIMKIDRMLLHWFSTVSNSGQLKLADSMARIRHSLEFLGPHAEESQMSSALEELQELSEE